MIEIIGLIIIGRFLLYIPKKNCVKRRNVLMASKVQALKYENFVERQYLKYVDMYAIEDDYKLLIYEDMLSVREENDPLIELEKHDASVLRFDSSMFGIELV